jgi:hypothetical protein
VVRGRLWRLSDPALAPAEREALVRELMAARRAVRDAKGDPSATAAARARVDAANGPVGGGVEPGPPHGAAVELAAVEVRQRADVGRLEHRPRRRDRALVHRLSPWCAGAALVPASRLS